jgi:aminomethyltransferase
MAAAANVSSTSASGGPRVFLTRTGYTGEAGYELFPPSGPGIQVWESLMALGGAVGIQPIGLGARDTLRLEKGFLLSGQDFTGQQTPLETNSAWVVKWDHSFMGRDALAAQRSRGDYRRLVGLKMADRGIPRHACAVSSHGTPVGTVTSGTMSPSLRVGVALASVEPTCAAVGTELAVEIRGVSHPAQVVRLPFL